MNNLVYIFIILCVLYFLSSKESFDNTKESYYIDDTGKHIISNLPLTLTDIYELHYVNTQKDNIQFILTKGFYKQSESKNEMKVVNNKSEKYQLIHLKNDIPFSGLLF